MDDDELDLDPIEADELEDDDELEAVELEDDELEEAAGGDPGWTHPDAPNPYIP